MFETRLSAIQKPEAPPGLQQTSKLGLRLLAVRLTMVAKRSTSDVWDSPRYSCFLSDAEMQNTYVRVSFKTKQNKNKKLQVPSSK